MQTFVGLLLLGGLCVVLWFVQAGIGKSVSAIDRSVRSKTHAEGLAEVHATLEITAPIAPADMITRIVNSVNAYPAAPAVVGGLYLKARSDDLAQFGFGSKAAGDSFDAAVQLSSTSTGCTGTYQILHWKESGADVVARRDMARLRGRVESAIRAAKGMSSGAN
jgi:hypothetical protein